MIGIVASVFTMRYVLTKMYCKALKRRITARKTPHYCKYYKSFIKINNGKGQ